MKVLEDKKAPKSLVVNDSSSRWRWVAGGGAFPCIEGEAPAPEVSRSGDAHFRIAGAAK